MSDPKQMTEAAYQAAYDKIETQLLVADEADRPALRTSLDKLFAKKSATTMNDFASRTALLNTLIGQLNDLIGAADSNPTINDALGEFNAILTSANEALQANKEA